MVASCKGNLCCCGKSLKVAKVSTKASLPRNRTSVVRVGGQRGLLFFSRGFHVSVAWVLRKIKEMFAQHHGPRTPDSGLRTSDKDHKKLQQMLRPIDATNKCCSRAATATEKATATMTVTETNMLPVIHGRHASLG